MGKRQSLHRADTGVSETYILLSVRQLSGLEMQEEYRHDFSGLDFYYRAKRKREKNDYSIGYDMKDIDYTKLLLNSCNHRYNK